jgi:type I restriction enzyme S subunit
MKVSHLTVAQDSITEKAVQETAVKLIAPEALLFVVRGMILAHSFPVAVAKTELTINQDMKALCPYLPEMAEFLLILMSGSKRRFLKLVERSSHGTCRLETEKLLACAMGVPPIEEQQRIVQTAAELMQICDTLESQLRQANKLAQRLAVAAVADFSGITVKREEQEDLKAPQTELVAQIYLGNTPDTSQQAPLATILARAHGEMSSKDLWQRFGGEIDVFYAQLKLEVSQGWIREPGVAEMREQETA